MTISFHAATTLGRIDTIRKFLGQEAAFIHIKALKGEGLEIASENSTSKVVMLCPEVKVAKGQKFALNLFSLSDALKKRGEVTITDTKQTVNLSQGRYKASLTKVPFQDISVEPAKDKSNRLSPVLVEAVARSLSHVLLTSSHIQYMPVLIEYEKAKDKGIAGTMTMVCFDHYHVVHYVEQIKGKDRTPSFKLEMVSSSVQEIFNLVKAADVVLEDGKTKKGPGVNLSVTGSSIILDVEGVLRASVPKFNPDLMADMSSIKEMLAFDPKKASVIEVLCDEFQRGIGNTSAVQDAGYFIDVSCKTSKGAGLNIGIKSPYGKVEDFVGGIAKSGGYKKTSSFEFYNLADTISRLSGSILVSLMEGKCLIEKEEESRKISYVLSASVK